MSEQWTLGDICEAIVDCEHRTAPIDLDGEYFAVGTPAMRSNVINYAEARPISRLTFESWTQRMRPRFGDLLLAREAPVGPVVRIPREENVAPGQRTVLLRPDGKVVDGAYLYYLLTSRPVQEGLQMYAEGSTVPHLNVADIRTFPLRRPPSLSEQRAIVGVLGALDDKIASNSALAKTADELALALFSESVRGVEVSDRTFDDVASVGGGGTPSSKVAEYWGGDISWATPTDVTALEGPYLFDTERRISEVGLANCSSPLYPAGSILMTSRATIGAFALAQEATAVNQGFIVVVAGGDVPAMWLFHEMRSRVPEFTSMANGATFLELSRGNFKKFGVRLADPAVMTRFDEQATALHDRAAAALKENARLKATRDALLPGLMSGKLRVRDAERLAEEVA